MRDWLFKRPADQPLHAIVRVCHSVETNAGPVWVNTPYGWKVGALFPASLRERPRRDYVTATGLGE